MASAPGLRFPVPAALVPGPEELFPRVQVPVPEGAVLSFFLIPEGQNLPPPFSPRRCATGVQRQIGA